jgi:hypothetical protein
LGAVLKRFDGNKHEKYNGRQLQRLVIKIDLPTSNGNLRIEGFLNWLDEVKRTFFVQKKSKLN